MKKILVILFLSTYLFSTTELGQLLKIPVLITHFLDHKKEDAEMTFWSHLVHHYGGHEKDTDMKLPFMKYTEVLTVMTVPPEGPVSLRMETSHFLAEKQHLFYKDPYLPSSFLDAIWQPPKYC